MMTSLTCLVSLALERNASRRVSDAKNYPIYISSLPCEPGPLVNRIRSRYDRNNLQFYHSCHTDLSCHHEMIRTRNYVLPSTP
ncbi:hypothetical protein M431DRAFT_517253 [Trichoderma harzianum CBS 226.95]|uniref:Uncharacterized protein n=1 Tax=Trichoderma harzianum CBS 226.95 TaxID=983964 RepID=A0A2T4AKK5_TRIHA|nr:hypothetical protein M431DRAFT_517253 [Trichoderma harzianum CBS 226.95]PTB57611.1 hypothetical protein M431DRAFT_517253 [Trichoderma harzianum CBS 226.95]